MRPVSNNYRTSQLFGSMKTAGVAPSKTPGTVGWYVHLYGNYQPLGHAGLDIACPVGTPIHAIADGTVIYSGWSEDLPGTGNVRKWLFYYNFGGILTLIQHDGWISVIAHQSNNDHVHVGMRVKEGQLIGLSGDTKTRHTKVAPHVHVEAIKYLDYRNDARNGVIYGRVDPTPYFGGLAAQGTTTTENTATEEDDMPTAAEVVDELLGREIKGDDGKPVKILWLLQSFHGIMDSQARKIAAATAELVWSAELPNVLTGGTTTPGLEVSWNAYNVDRILKNIDDVDVPAGFSKDEYAALLSESLKAAADKLTLKVIAEGNGA